MSSIGASYAPLHLMQKQLKEKKLKREKEREDKAQSLAVVETSLAATGRKSNKIYPSRSSYSEQVERPNHKSEI
ncbi:hypothetical protein N665_0264s0012 [Sinapis alba]|nr:hypothetical protein N665_3439s0002 [Sinapis alba]KAF8098508.1 hypothetical protein N665_0264s0012 [Sinapis alba]